MLRLFVAPASSLVAIFLLVQAVPAAAESDQDRARQAFQRGQIRPLDEVLAVARKALPGEVVKVEFDRDDGRWIYEITILTASGERREIEIDAGSLRILEID